MFTSQKIFCACPRGGGGGHGRMPTPPKYATDPNPIPNPEPNPNPNPNRNPEHNPKPNPTPDPNCGFTISHKMKYHRRNSRVNLSPQNLGVFQHGGHHGGTRVQGIS